MHFATNVTVCINGSRGVSACQQQCAEAASLAGIAVRYLMNVFQENDGFTETRCCLGIFSALLFYCRAGVVALEFVVTLGTSLLNSCFTYEHDFSFRIECGGQSFDIRD